jgi:hypothetical protein
MQAAGTVIREVRTELSKVIVGQEASPPFCATDMRSSKASRVSPRR